MRSLESIMDYTRVAAVVGRVSFVSGEERFEPLQTALYIVLSHRGCGVGVHQRQTWSKGRELHAGEEHPHMGPPIPGGTLLRSKGALRHATPRSCRMQVDVLCMRGVRVLPRGNQETVWTLVEAVSAKVT